MKWFQHSAEFSTLDELGLGVREDLGLEGLARLFIIFEIITRNAESPASKMSVTLSRKHWARLLGLQQRTLKKFLQSLQTFPGIRVEEVGKRLCIEIPKIAEMLTNRAISSRLRGSTGSPREEGDEEEEQKAIFLTSHTAEESKFLSEVRRLLGGSDVFTLPQKVFAYFENQGPNMKLKKELIAQVQKQFGPTEKAQKARRILIDRIESEYADALASFSVGRVCPSETAKERAARIATERSHKASMRLYQKILPVKTSPRPNFAQPTNEKHEEKI